MQKISHKKSAPVKSCYESGRAPPKNQIIQSTICADNDNQTIGNPGLTKATAAAQAINGLIAVPEFPEGSTGTDFNDL